MSSSDDEEFLLAKFGTPLPEIDEDTEPSKKKPIALHEQIVTDSEGRRRFHGAFTGGFSAGYYNTVSTKDGWTPTAFRSSRSDRNKKTSMQPEDFMDEEDMSEYGIAPQKIVTQSAFSDKERDQKMRMAEKFTKNSTMLLGMDMLQALVIPVSNNVGVKLLRKMHWKPGQGIGPHVARKRKKAEDEFMPQNMTFAPKDKVPMDFTVKDNVHGIGYTGMDPKLALHDKVKKSSAITFQTKTGTKLSFAGQAFGVGAYEVEEDDIYAQDSMANYDLVMGEEKQDASYGWSKPTKAITAKKDLPAITYVRKVLEGFKKAEKTIRRRIYSAPELPPDFDPNKRLKLQRERERLKNPSATESQPDSVSERKKFERLNPSQRGDLLGEEQLKSDKEDHSVESVFSLLKPQDRRRLQKARMDSIKPEGNAPKKSAIYEPFALNPAKQSRYKQYLAALKERKSDPYSHVEQDQNMTEWERHQELEEFTKSSRFFQPLSMTMSSRFTSESQELKEQDVKEKELKKAAQMKMFGLMTRESMEWHPDPLLCKRFNVPNPYPNSDIIGLPGKSSEHKGNELFLHPNDFRRQKPEKKQQLSIEANARTAGSTGIIVSDIRNPTTHRKDKSKMSSRWDEEPALQGPSDRPSAEDEMEKPPSLETKEEKSDPTSDSEDAKPSERPSMDIFKAIFENSDDDDSSEEEEDEEDMESEEIHSSTDVASSVSNNRPNSETAIMQEDTPAPVNLSEPPGNGIDSHNQRHIFTLKPKENRDKTLLHNTSSVSTQRNNVSEDETEDVFGPALPPPSKISKLWEVTDPESLTGKASKKKKHKKDKHKVKKSKKKHKKRKT